MNSTSLRDVDFNLLVILEVLFDEKSVARAAICESLDGDLAPPALLNHHAASAAR